MTKETLLQYFNQHHFSRRDVLPRIPLGINPDELWREILSHRKAKSTTLPIHGPRGEPYWYVITDKMVNASVVLVEELMENEDTAINGQPVLAPLEEVFYTSYVEGSPMTMQAAMVFLQEGEEPRDVEELMIANNRNALNFAAANLYHPVDEEFIQTITLILTQNMQDGGREYRTSDQAEIPSMMGEPYELPTASSVPYRLKELTAYLDDSFVHPLLKAAVAQAWVLVTRPFPEGNERLARLLSNVILIRAGYTFLSEVSLSALIARNGYPYYNAVSNILRSENGGDLTYFLEYFILLLAEAVEEHRKRKREDSAEVQAAEMALARTALVQSVAAINIEPEGVLLQTDVEPEQAHNEQVGNEVAVAEAKQLNKRGRPKGKGKADTQRDSPTETSTGYASASEALAAAGFVSFLDENMGESSPQEGGESRWSGENRVREKLARLLNSRGTLQNEVGQILLGYLDAGKYAFSSNEIKEAMHLTSKQTSNLLRQLREKEIIEFLGKTTPNESGTYIFCCIGLSESDYTPEMRQNLGDLQSGSHSMRDKRIGTMILQRLSYGYISIREYENAGDGGRWAEDMKLAEQMGLVRRVTKEICFIQRDAKPCFEMLDLGQKKRAKMMYDTFGEEFFSHEMVVATLDYSSSTASAYLHQFTLLHILNCKKGDVNLYQFLVNPTEHPEVFGTAA